MINIGINGFGRIGKCLLLQLLENPKFSIKCLNAMDINISEIEDYLQYDTTHKHNMKIKVEQVFDDKQKSNNLFKINNHIIQLVSERDAIKIDWNAMGCEYLIDATGAYLTTKKCNDHNCSYVVMSSPAKDKETNTFIYGANHAKYQSERVISGSSCTTNCIAPLLKLLHDEYGVDNCVFTTIHATTASQFTVDVLKKSSRTNRSILNNIIPHTTGASSSVTCVIPELDGKINGTSVRIPVSNSSLVDLNIELTNTNITLKDIEKLLLNHKYYKIVYDVSTKKLVSSDFITTTTPTILDMNASIDMGHGKFKLMVWYDNEWSYSAQLIRLVEHMYIVNQEVKPKYYMENLNITNKGVVCRFDYNVPMNNSNEVSDEFRIFSSIDTIKSILEKSPKYIVLTSHFGRPNTESKDPQFSLKFAIPILERLLGRPVEFLEDGLSLSTLDKLQNRINDTAGIPIYLLENLRFHKEETDYEKDATCVSSSSVLNIYKELGDVFICDAFGCLHRKHMSIYAMKTFGKPYGYGHLIQKELTMLNKLIENTDKKILGIIGGNKIKDKLPIIESLKLIPGSTIYIAGGLSKQYKPTKMNEYLMVDGYGARSLYDPVNYIEHINYTDLNTYDIGNNSMQWLIHYVNNADVIFWNGPLGVINHPEYRKGSVELLDYLIKQKNKQIIIGGGETSSLVTDKLENSNIYVSTGGGALLEYLQNKLLYNKTLVGLEIYL